MDPDKRQEDNLEATGNTIDDIDRENQDDEFLEYTYVNVGVAVDEVTGVINPDGTNALEGIDTMDCINQMANMDKVASRKGMRDLQDTTDMQNTDEINNVDFLDSSKDIAYTDNEDQPYWLRCPNCQYEFQVSQVTVRNDIPTTCPKCSTIFESEAYVL